MKKYFITIFLMLGWVMGPAIVSLAAGPAGDLTIIELKMTGSETLVIENTSAQPLNLSNYILQYFNKSSPASFAVPTDGQQLPDTTLEPNQAILLNSDSAPTCGAAAVSELEFTLADTGGYLGISKFEAQSDGSTIFKPQDHVSWTSASSGADVAKVPSATADPKAVWYRKLSDGSWQASQLNGDCTMLTTMITPADGPTYVQWASGDEAPATIVSLTQNGTPGPDASIPRSDIGLAAPQITELLPNVAAPQTDAEDEFIELYNPNSATFDLSGFELEVGLTAKHDFKFPGGTTLAPKSFRSFFSIDTGLALSNSGGQAMLIDPLGTVIGQSDAYGTAKDGQAWALANGKWYWTVTPTPNAANSIKQTASAAASSSKSSSKSSKRTAAPAGSVKGKSTVNSAASLAASTDKPAAVHPLVLAGIGVLAVVYALYEYRHDLANRFYKLRANRAAGPSAGKKS